MQKKYHIWNNVFSTLFIVIIIVFMLYLNQQAIVQAPGLIVLILLALSTYRVSRLLKSDKITKQYREKIAEKAKYNSFFYTINETIICSWCSSVWVGLFFTIFYYLTPLIIPVLVILTISAIASIMQVIMNKY